MTTLGHMRQCRGNEPLEERVRGAGARAEFGMELAGNEPRIVLQFNNFGQFSIR